MIKVSNEATQLQLRKCFFGDITTTIRQKQLLESTASLNGINQVGNKISKYSLKGTNLVESHANMVFFRPRKSDHTIPAPLFCAKPVRGRQLFPYPSIELPRRSTWVRNRSTCKLLRNVWELLTVCFRQLVSFSHPLKPRVVGPAGCLGIDFKHSSSI